LKIELTETEITHIMDALDARIEDLKTAAMFGDANEIEDEIAELTDLSMDLFEAMSRPEDPFSGSPVVDAALDMVQAGIDAREQVKASSRAADRRNERMMKGTASPVTRDFSNDPIDW
tara:strand:- start:7 stop:360 length:354 start_codon:yes stop_codon:yes gene_type:complete